MRVLILPEWFPSESEPTAGLFVRDQARAASRAHDVTVVVHDPRRRRSRRASITTSVEEGVRTIRVRTRGRRGTTAGRLEFILALLRQLQRMRRRGEAPELTHAHVFSAGFIALLVSHGRLPVVVSEHHTDFVEDKVVGRDARVAHFVFRHADRVCPVSTSLKTCLEKFEPSGRYEVVPNVVDLEVFLAAAERRSGRGAVTRLLVVAMLVPQKGIEYLLDALAQLRAQRSDFTLDVVGDGPGRRELERIAHNRLPHDAVSFHGSQPRAEVARFMARSDVFVLPSIAETFGVVVIEALAAGMPIIATSAVPDHDRLQGFGIFVPPRDSEALRAAVVTMLDKGWDVPREAALETVMPFSAAAVAGQWNAIYQSIARTS